MVDLEGLLPAGNPDDWTDQEWDELDSKLEPLTLDQQAAAWDLICKRWEYPATSPAKQVEWDDIDAEFYATLGKEGGFYDEPEPNPSKPGATCICDGPPNGKYLSHMRTCPAWVQVPGTGKFGGYTYKKCKHEHTPLVITDEVTLQGSAARDVKEWDAEQVDIGLYLAGSWHVDLMTTPGVDASWVRDEQWLIDLVFIEWPDYSAPKLEHERLVRLIEWLVEAAKSGKKVEVGCVGGHGRTGTMLALVACYLGFTPGAAVALVREKYCDHAIESSKQFDYIRTFYEEVHGKDWTKDKAAHKLWKKWHKEYMPKQKSAPVVVYDATKGKTTGMVWGGWI